MAIAVVQSVIADGGVSSSPSVTWPSSTTSGNLVIAQVLADQGSGEFITPPSGYSTAFDVYHPTSFDLHIQQFYIGSCGVRSGAETFTLTNPRNSILMLMEVSGIVVAGAIDVTNTNTGTSTSASTGTITTTQADEILVGFTGYYGLVGETNQGSPAFGFTMAQQLLVSNGLSRWDAALLYLIVSATGGYVTNTTENKNTPWCAGITGYKSSGSGVIRRRSFESFIG